MKSTTLIALAFLLFSVNSKSQTTRLSEIGVSQLFIWNNTTVYDVYSGARAADKTGHAWSYGTNINYTYGLTKNLIAQIGLGYFKQRFGIRRGFDFEEPNVATALFYTTKNYGYRSLHYFGGIGYTGNIKPASKSIFIANTRVRLLALYNLFNTFRQEFRHNFDGNLFGNPNPQIRKDSYHYGSSVTIKGGLVCPVGKNFRAGLDLVVPVYNRWHKDVIFREDASEYHGADFSVGTSLNLFYSLK